MLLRRLARPLLASVFVSSGLQTLLNPEPKAQAVAPLLEKTGDTLPIDEPKPMTMVQVNAAVNVAAGSLLAAGYLPRLASMALASTLVPTTIADHPFWQEKDQDRRSAQQALFFKNLALLGGLLLASADTRGRPSLGWWARRAVRKASAATQHAAYTVGDTAHDAVERAHDVVERAGDLTGDVAGRVRAAVR